MIFVLDNYDSFTYNLVQLFYNLEPEIVVRRNREISVPEVLALHPAAIILSPGPGRPSEAGIMPELIRSAADREIPLLGVCLGMQLLFERSFEYGNYEGLGLLTGNVRPIADVITPGLKIPQIGWNAIHFEKENALLGRIKEGDHVYFVHSYHATGCEEWTTAVTEYGGFLTASVERNNVFGTQFHPELMPKDQRAQKLLQAFVEASAAN